MPQSCSIIQLPRYLQLCLDVCFPSTTVLQYCAGGMGGEFCGSSTWCYAGISWCSLSWYHSFIFLLFLMFHLKSGGPPGPDFKLEDIRASWLCPSCPFWCSGRVTHAAIDATSASQRCHLWYDSSFLSDPGKPGVRSLGPDVCPSVRLSVCPYTLLRLNWYMWLWLMKIPSQYQLIMSIGQFQAM